MRSVSSLLIVSLIALSSSGCFKQMIKIGDGGDVTGMADYDQTQFFFVEGLVGQGNTVDVGQICKESKSATVVLEQPIQWALVENCLCAELVNPMSVKVYCSKKKSTEATSLKLEQVLPVRANAPY